MISPPQPAPPYRLRGTTSALPVVHADATRAGVDEALRLALVDVAESASVYLDPEFGPEVTVRPCVVRVTGVSGADGAPCSEAVRVTREAWGGRHNAPLRFDVRVEAVLNGYPGGGVATYLVGEA